MMIYMKIFLTEVKRSARSVFRGAQANPGRFTAIRRNLVASICMLFPVSLLAFGCASERSAMTATAFFYGSPVPAAALSKFERVVVEADNVESLGELRKFGAEIFAYVSVGEAEGWRASSRTLPDALFLGSNSAWNSRIADLTQAGWREYLLEERMAVLWENGYRSFFLDTLESYQLAVKNPAGQTMQLSALAEIIRAIHRRFPGARLLLNRGFDLMSEIAPLAVGVVAESLFQSWNAVTQEYVAVGEDDRKWLMARLNEARVRYRLPITIIDYVSPEKPELARETAKRIAALGFAPWVANPALDTLAVGAKE